MKNLTYLFFIGLFILSACKKEPVTSEQEPVDSSIQKILPCNDYQTSKIDPQDGVEYYRAFTKHNGSFVFGGDDKIVFKNSLEGVPFMEFEESRLEVRKLLPYQGKLLICAWGGVFEIDENMEFRQVSDLSCSDIHEFENRILFTGSPDVSFSDDFEHRNILELFVEKDSIGFFTDPTEPELKYGLQDFEIFGDEIWAKSYGSREPEIVRFSRNDYIQTFTPENDPGIAAIEFPGGVNNGYLLEDNGVVYYYVSNGLTNYFLKNETGEQFELIKIHEPDNAETDLDIEFLRGSANEAKIVRGQLFIATTSGRLFKFDLSNNDLEFEMVRDTFLPNTHVTDFYIDEFDNQHYFISNYNVVTQINCN